MQSVALSAEGEELAIALCTPPPTGQEERRNVERFNTFKLIMTVKYSAHSVIVCFIVLENIAYGC